MYISVSRIEKFSAVISTNRLSMPLEFILAPYSSPWILSLGFGIAFIIITIDSFILTIFCLDIHQSFQFLAEFIRCDFEFPK